MLVVVAIAATLLVPIVVQVAVQAHSEIVAADDAAAADDENAEVIHLGRALRWRLPLSSHDEHAIDRLLAIGERAEADPADVAHARALAAYREIRSALLGSRALDVPHADVLADVDARIARLMAAQSHVLGVVAQDEARQHERLRATSEASRIGPVLAALALVAWVGATLLFLARGVDARGRL
ncbi:MAG TPA: hypothetical protein VG755_23105, partial [Nannocystaceae bacterium]|nr:hypothetical protein [Nannocystaceae bacterium]